MPRYLPSPDIRALIEFDDESLELAERLAGLSIKAQELDLDHKAIDVAARLIRWAAHGVTY